MIGRISALLVTALLMAAPASPAELTATDVESWLNGLMNYGLENGDIAGSVVVVVKDGKVLFQSGYGYADVAKRIPMDPGKVMTRIGSTSKLFTWTAVMQLVEQGKLDLNRNVDDYLDFKVSPAGGKPITLLNLMNHRGGFEEGLKDIFALDPERLQSQQAYLKQHPRPLLFPTGTVPAYSNYGTALAGYIVERVSGEPCSRYIENHILRPLGMAHSTFDQPLPARFKGQAALGYRQASQTAQPYELVATSAAGSAATTASDMARFMLAHLQPSDLLHSDTAQLMHSPSETALPGFGTIAHGFFYETRNGRTLIGHGGDTAFFHTELDLLPQEGVGIFYSFNSRGREDAVYGLRKAVLDQFMDRYFPNGTGPDSTAAEELVTLSTAKADSQKIAGRYETSRRVEHGFLSVFYLLQQTVIGANPDGTLTAPKFLEPGEAQFREVAPDIWQEVGGHRKLALQNVNGINTIVESDDPTSVLQLVPTRRSAALNITVFVASFVVLISAVILWPISYLVRRHYQRSPSDGRKFRIILRAAALFDILWLVAWFIVLTPVLNVQLDFYSSALDPVIRTLQLAGVVVPVLAVVGIACLWRLWSGVSWPARIGNGLIAAGLVGLVWIGIIGGLISFNLNY